jgi:hypothetical protein
MKGRRSGAATGVQMGLSTKTRRARLRYCSNKARRQYDLLTKGVKRVVRGFEKTMHTHGLNRSVMQLTEERE